MTDDPITLTVNGELHQFAVPGEELLVETLRERLDLVGTKLGCGVGMCGACSVLVDGVLVSGCLLPTAAADGCRVVTVEGLEAEAPALTRALHEAFETHGGYQCGICTPGQMVAAVALLRHDPEPSDADVRGQLAGNLCRCTGYAGIVSAVTAAAAQVAEGAT